MRPSLPLTTPPTSLCLLRLSALGDVCNAVPVVRTLQKFWPETRLTWVVGKLEAGLVGDIPGVEFITFDKRAGWRAYRALRRRLRDRRFDVLLHMQVALRANLAGLMIPARMRLGFDRARAKDGHTWVTNARIAGQPRQHVVDGFFGFLEALGLPERELRWDLPIPPAARAFAEQHLPGTQPTLIISPCSSVRARNFRNWSAEGYAAVADYAAEKLGMRVVLTGGPTDLERDYAAAIGRLAKQPPIDLIGQTSLKELLAVLERATALVSPDSGPAHMATAVGTPVIGLYVTSNPDRTGPYLSREWVVNKYPEAVQAEFGKRVEDIAWGRRVRDPAAVNSVRVADVTDTLMRVMSSSNAPINMSR
ncbi:glycosyltransferase family 9 protein [Ectothiorhodospiraceae bacterium 2226]|nr:glycosyltransferase family 9 protein [Ectothiorhodospiraceae bacterium 2226]